MEGISKKCPECSELEKVIKNWKYPDWTQKYKCKMCWNNFKWEVIQDDFIPDIEEAKIKQELSTDLKHVSFRNNYKNTFDVQKESKKYWFTFSSWKEYYSKRSKLVPKKKKDAKNT